MPAGRGESGASRRPEKAGGGFVHTCFFVSFRASTGPISPGPSSAKFESRPHFGGALPWPLAAGVAGQWRGSGSSDCVNSMETSGRV